MKISILLPYKENFSPVYPGAVSLFVKDTANLSKYKKNIIVYGNTSYKKLFNISGFLIILCGVLSIIELLTENSSSIFLLGIVLLIILKIFKSKFY